MLNYSQLSFRVLILVPMFVSLLACDDAEEHVEEEHVEENQNEALNGPAYNEIKRLNQEAKTQFNDQAFESYRYSLSSTQGYQCDQPINDYDIIVRVVNDQVVEAVVPQMRAHCDIEQFMTINDLFDQVDFAIDQQWNVIADGKTLPEALPRYELSSGVFQSLYMQKNNSVDSLEVVLTISDFVIEQPVFNAAIEKIELVHRHVRPCASTITSSYTLDASQLSEDEKKQLALILTTLETTECDAYAREQGELVFYPVFDWESHDYQLFMTQADGSTYTYHSTDESVCTSSISDSHDYLATDEFQALTVTIATIVDPVIYDGKIPRLSCVVDPAPEMPSDTQEVVTELP
ncbi:MAG: hypothetical protein HRU20_10685 [Pseudomonadales bacterium]|nr:hypothetical protein [Pseudomonadales bacterium]